MKKHPGYSFLLVNDMKCIEDNIKSLSPESLSLLQECWKEITGIEPKQDSDYTELYCRDESPYILVNMVHDCFLRSFVRDRVEAITRNQTKTVDKMRTVKNLYHRVNDYIYANVGYDKCYPSYQSDVGDLLNTKIVGFLECMDLEHTSSSTFFTDTEHDDEDEDEDENEEEDKFGPVARTAVEYFETIYKLNDPTNLTIDKPQNTNNRSYCDYDLQEAIEQIKCLKEKTQENVIILEMCFKDITWTSSQFPTSDAQIKSYLCSDNNKLPYPLALIKKVEECAIRQIRGPNEYSWDTTPEICISKEMFYGTVDDDYNSFVPDDIQIVYHNQMCRGNNVSAIKEWLSNKPSANATACVSDKLKKESVGKSNVGKVIDYCWSFFMSHGQFVNSTVKEIPNSDEEWIKFYCSHDYYNKRMALPSFQPVNFCMARMLQLDSRSMTRDGIPNPARSPNEVTMMDCLGVSD